MQNDDQDKKQRQLDNLTNLVENHTRTKRHLEQYSEIGNPKFKNMARDHFSSFKTRYFPIFCKFNI